jgi:hypothetical protein
MRARSFAVSLRTMASPFYPLALKDRTGTEDVGTLILHNGVGWGYHIGALHSQRSPGISESTVILLPALGPG